MKLWFWTLILCWLWAGSATGQPSTGQPFPSLVLKEEDGGRMGGGAWRCQELAGKPCLIVLVNPDEEDLLGPIERALSATPLTSSEGQLVKVMDTRASWKPDRLIKAGNWLSVMSEKVSDAREHGVVEALFTVRKNKPATWTIVYDQNQVFRDSLRLNNMPVHVFLLDKQGIIVTYASGKPTDGKARAWLSMLKQLGA